MDMRALLQIRADHASGLGEDVSVGPIDTEDSKSRIYSTNIPLASVLFGTCDMM